MKTREITYFDSADEATRGEIGSLVERAGTLQDIIDYWCVERRAKMYVGSVLDDDDSVMDGVVGISFDAPDKVGELACVVFDPAEIARGVEVPPVFEAFTKPPTEERWPVDVNDDALDQWMETLGFTSSDALLARVGPRTAVVPLVLCFALSPSGTVEIRQTDSEWFSEEEVAAELKEEGLDMADFIEVHACYSGPPSKGVLPQIHFDPVYCRRLSS